MAKKRPYEWLRRRPSDFVWGVSTLLFSIWLAVSRRARLPDGFAWSATFHSLAWLAVGAACFQVVPLRFAHLSVLISTWVIAYLYPRVFNPGILGLFAISCLFYGGIIGGHLKWVVLKRRENKSESEGGESAPVSERLHLGGLDFFREELGSTGFRRERRSNLIIATAQEPRIEIPGADLDAVALEQLTVDPGHFSVGEDIWLTGTDCPSSALEQLVEREGAQAATMILTDGDRIYGSLDSRQTAELSRWLKARFAAS